MRSKIDLLQLRAEIRDMKPGNQLYIVLKDELSKPKQAHWKNKPRGKEQPVWILRK